MNLAKNIKNYFPSSKGNWIKYTLTSLPVIFAAMIFAFNSFVDNFMAIDIAGGNQALSYANSWTSLVNGIIAATTIVGSALFGQYLGLENNNKIKDVINGRMIIALSITIIFTIPTLIIPDKMIYLISGLDNNISSNVFNRSSNYLRWISIAWILSAWVYTTSMILREAGHGKASLISSSISLLSNIVFNSIFIYGFKQNIEFLAYSTIVSQIISLLFNTTYVFLKDKRLIINPLKMFFVSPEIWKQFIKRWSSYLLLIVSSITISIRFVFWNVGYPTGSIDNKAYQLSAAAILGISGMFFNIFWTTFESINANVAIFVGRELGHNNIETAKKNAKELQGFHFVVSIIMALLLFVVSMFIEQMTFLAEGFKKELKGQKINPEIINEAVHSFLNNLKKTIWPLAWNIPMFVWFITRNRIISSGGLTNLTSIIDSCMGIFQTCYIIVINFVLVKYTNIEFPWAYAVFFTSDIFKFFVYEITYHKVNWARNVTKESMNTLK